jgi:ankyrin repeat protein
LRAFFAGLGSDDPFFQYKGWDAFGSLYATSKNPLELRKAILHLTSTIPDDIIDKRHKSKALAERELPRFMVTEMLKVVFFRLSNKMIEYYGKGLEVHDRFMLHLVEAISCSNPETISTLFSGKCITTKAIKEAVYGSAIRQKNYAIISRLLQSGVDPQLPVRATRTAQLVIDRVNIQITGEANTSWYCLDCMEEAAYTCDIRLGEILFRAKANVNRSEPLGLSPLELAAYARGDLDKHDDAVDFARMLVEHGAAVDPPALSCLCKGVGRLSPLTIAITSGNNRLVEFLMEKGATIDLPEHSITEGCHCKVLRWNSGAFKQLNIICTPLNLAIFSGNDEITRRLLQPVLLRPIHTITLTIKQLLLTSCLVGDVVTASKLLVLGVDLNNGWSHGVTPLVAAIWNSENTIIELLLASGAHVGPTLKEKVLQTSTPTPLHIAAFRGHTNLVRQLIDRGVDCTVKYAPELDLVEELLPSCLSSPLQCALDSGDVDTASLLIPHSNITGGELAQAIDIGDKILISDIVSKCGDILFIDDNGMTALEAAATAGNETVILSYFSSGGVYRSSALYLATKVAVESKDYSIVRLLTEFRPPGEIDSHEASSLVRSLEGRDWALTRLFLSDPFLAGPSRSFYRNFYGRPHPFFSKDFPDHRGNGRTPLSEAILSGNMPIIEEMLKRGYILHASDVTWLTPAENSTYYQIVDLVRSPVWSMFPQESMVILGRQTLLLDAIRTGDVQRLRERIKLVDSFEFVEKQDYPLKLAARGGHIEIVRLLLNSGANIEYEPNGFNTVLQEVAKKGNLDIVELLVERGAVVNPPRQMASGATALQYAAIQGHLSVAKFLIERGADINAPAAKSYGRTALEGAAENGRLDLVHLLLEMNVKLDKEMRIHYVRSIGFAIQNGHYAIANYLKDCGSWRDRDQDLYDRCGINLDDENRYFQYDEKLDDWHIRWMLPKGNGDYYSVALSEGSSTDRSFTGSSDNGDVEVEDMDQETHNTLQTWWNSMDFTLTGPTDLNFTAEEMIGHGFDPPWMGISERGITDLDETLEGDDVNQQIALLGNSGAVTDHAEDQQLRICGQTTTTGEEVPNLESTSRQMLEIDFPGERSTTFDVVETEWQGPFFGADEVTNLNDDYDMFPGLSFSL